MIDNLRDRPGMVIANFFLLVGACFNPADKGQTFAWADLPALPAGILITLTLLVTGLPLLLKYISAKKRYWPFINRLFAVRQGPFLGAALLFLLLSCAAFATGRSTTDAVATDSRYRDFSVFTSAMAYCLVLLALAPGHRRGWLGMATAGSLLFCTTSYALYTPRLLSQNADYKAGAYNWHRNHHWLIYKEASYFNTVADKVSAGLDTVDWYRILTYFADSSAVSTALIKALDIIDTQKQVAYWRLPTDPVGPEQPYFRVEHNHQVYLLAVKRPTTLTNLFRTGSTLGPYFITDFAYGQLLLPGRYTVSILLDPANKRLAFSPGLTLDVRSP